MPELPALRRLLRPPETLYGAPWRHGIDELASRGGLAAQRGAPFRTGKLQAAMRTRVQRKPFPEWIGIYTYARSASRYPYPRLLAFSWKHGHRDWLLRALQPVWGRVEETLKRIANDIGNTWSRG